MTEDIGESLVGAYFRYVRSCEFVLFNTFLTRVQGEIDVIGIRLGDPRVVYFAEVTTHLGGMSYGDGATVARVKSKLARAKEFAEERFPGDVHHFSVWSPRVPIGAMTVAFAELATEFAGRGRRLSFVINREYGDCLQQLVAVAKSIKRSTSDPAFRLLQVLTRVKTSGGRLEL